MLLGRVGPHSDDSWQRGENRGKPAPEAASLAKKHSSEEPRTSRRRAWGRGGAPPRPDLRPCPHLAPEGVMSLTCPPMPLKEQLLWWFLPGSDGQNQGRGRFLYKAVTLWGQGGHGDSTLQGSFTKTFLSIPTYSLSTSFLSHRPEGVSGRLTPVHLPSQDHG